MGRKLVQQEQQDDAQAGNKPRRRSRRRTAGLWTLRGVFILVFLALITGFMAIGHRLHAPVWLRDRVEARIDAALGGVKVQFGDVSFIIHEGWRPRLRLTDVRISDAAGQQIAEVSDLRASLSMRPLLRGHVRPKRIILEGAQIALTRGVDGALSLTVGAGSAPVGQAPNLAQLIERSDAVFMSPILSALTSVELDAITLDYQDLRLGRSWVLDGGRIQATRSAGEVRLATGFSVLAGRDYVSMIEANYTSQLGSPTARFGVSITDLPAEDIAGHSPALAWMQVLKTPISGALRGSVDAEGALGPVFATLNLGVGAVQPTLETTPIKFDSARTYFTYDPARQVLDFNEVSISSAWGTVQADGKAFLQGVNAGGLDSMSAQFRLSGIEVNPANLFPEALNLTKADVDFQMKLAPFRLQLGQMTIEDGAHRARLSGSLAGLSEGWVAEIDAQIDRMKSDQLLKYWPERLAPKPRLWVTENVHYGEMSDLDFALRLRPGEKPDIYLDFEFENTKVRFAKTLPPIENAQGQASLLNRRFTVSAQQGIVIADKGGAVDASGTSFIIPDTSIKKTTPGIARIRASGSVTAALSLLDRPPLQLLTKANLPVDLADGQVRLGGTLSLPLIKGLKLNDTRFHFTGELSNLDSDKLVPGFNISADRLTLTGDQSQVAIEGDGLFGVVPVVAAWRQPIGGDTPQRSELTGEIELSPRLMEQINAGLPRGMLVGQGIAEFNLSLGAGEPPRLTADSDLVGVALAIPELGWRKPANTSGTLMAQATLGAQLKVDALRIDTAGLRTAAEISFRDGTFDRVQFSSFELGDWLAVPAELIGRGAALPDIRVLGGVLDLGKSSLGEGSNGGDEAGPGPRLDVTLDRLQVTETVALTGLTGSFQTTGGLNGSFAAQVNGGASIRGQVTPRASRSAVGLTSDDAGAVLRSAGVLTQARGGSLQVQLDPVAAPGNYDVDLQIRDTRIKDAPAMAALLNAISLVGLLDEMAGQGIFFSAIDSKMRITPTEVKVLSGSAVGPSMGLSFDGTIDTVAGMLNLRGAISPIYLVNVIGSILTKKGEGIFAFNYTLTGPLTKPQVSVNPLSGLAPLFLRNLLREPAPTVSDGPKATTDPSAGPRPDTQTRGENR
ncbi:Uncharacterized protein involved in outer membrane biogenesis [Ruegeria halocynthiae]|uniref:Uncharacterized protein involved in outer membrane biogenesis n=1 Tax=Ruegeria halocynthiae TaxID=985054 RepID=A0A1H2SCK4_9RHOB|nr:DUF3971 domain-containing protein [Ruegeria halocynthiae]SDW29312.1 Uncharacterized protein involved in outer membrane biogenesis [Ruegeria halocynthiae]